MADKLVVKGVVDVKDRKPFALYCDDPSLTVQSQARESDINQIVSRAMKGHDISHVESRVARFGDFSDVPDYQSALDLVMRAKGMFDELSAKVRDRFNNEPAKMIAFLQDPGNRDEAIALGLVVGPVVEPVAEVKAVAAAPKAG